MLLTRKSGCKGTKKLRILSSEMRVFNFTLSIFNLRPPLLKTYKNTTFS